MEKSYVASGNLMGALLDANREKVSGYIDMGEAYPVSIETKLKQKKQKSARKGMRGQIRDSGATIDEVVGGIGIKNWIAKNIAMLVSGSAVEISADTGSVADMAVDLPTDNSWVSLGHRNVSNVLITGLTEDVEFEVKAALGLIRGLDTNTGAQTVSFDHAGETGYKIDIGTESVIRMALLIDGQNDEDGTPFIGEFDSVVFIPKGPLNIISDPETDYEQMEFDLLFETVTGKTSPGTINGFPVTA